MKSQDIVESLGQNGGLHKIRGVGNLCQLCIDGRRSNYKLFWNETTVLCFFFLVSKFHFQLALFISFFLTEFGEVQFKELVFYWLTIIRKTSMKLGETDNLKNIEVCGFQLLNYRFTKEWFSYIIVSLKREKGFAWLNWFSNTFYTTGFTILEQFLKKYLKNVD